MDQSASAATRMIKMPMTSGTTWNISQGYNGNPNTGGSHYNCADYPERSCSSTWTYKYSLDFTRVGGDTAGATVLSPVNGTIRWIDEAYGGMSINLGNGWAVAYFHTTIAEGLVAGQTVTQGQYMGVIAPPGQGGNGGFPHLHLTLWQTNDGGNWNRVAKPFVGTQALDGVEFPALSNSTYNQHKGKAVTSSNAPTSTAPPPPRQVAKLSPSHNASISDSTVTLSWSPVSGATSYQVLVDDGQQTSPWISGISWTTNTLPSGAHTWKVRGRNSAGNGTWSSTWKFAITTGVGGAELDNGSRIATGTYRVYGTREGLVGGRTSSGHIIVENDHFVSLPACVATTCAWLTPGTTDPTFGYVTDCGDKCYVVVKNPANNTCRVEPVLDRGPWFNVDNYWDVSNKRFVNAEISRDDLGYALAQGYSAAAAARDGYDVGWGKQDGIGRTNRKDVGDYDHDGNTTEYTVTGQGNSIDIADGTWLELGFPWDPGPQVVVVTMLWQVSQSVASAELACEGAPAPEPYFTMSKSSGVAGTVITVNGKNYGKQENVRIYLDSMSNPAIGSVTTDSTGRFTTTFTVPNTVGGTHRIHVVGKTSKLRVAKDFRILPKASTSSTSGSAGLTLSLSGYNFAAGETVDLFWDSNSSASATGTANSSGKVVISVKAPSINGLHTARLTGRTNHLNARVTFTVVQRVRVTPTSAASGTSVKVYGTGWPANKTVSFRWNSATGTILCSAITNSAGYAECTFKPPTSATAGAYRIYGTDGARTASTAFQLTFGGSEDPTETPTASATPSPTETVDPGTPDASPVESETPVESPTDLPTEEIVPTEVPPTEIPPTATATEAPLPTETPTSEPTVAPEPRTVEVVSVADTSVTYATPEAPQSPESAGNLLSGGTDTAVTYISFNLSGVGTGVVTEAYLEVTGTGGGGAGGTIGIIAGYIVDENGTYLSLPTQGIGAAYARDGSPSYLGGVGAGETVFIDVTRSVQADGQYTFVILGDPGTSLELSSSEGSSAPKLRLVVQDL